MLDDACRRVEVVAEALRAKDEVIDAISIGRMFREQVFGCRGVKIRSAQHVGWCICC